MHTKQWEQKISYYTYIAMLAGVFVGSIIYLCLCHNHSLLAGGGLEDYKISGVLDLPVKQLFFYIFRRRIGQILLYMLLVSMFSYSVITSIFCFSFGVYYGAAVCSFLMKSGWKGIAYLNFCFFPHYMFYFLAIYLFGYWFWMQRKSAYLEHINVNKITNYLKKIVIITFVILPILWEAFFQKNILNFFYQYLVQ